MSKGILRLAVAGGVLMGLGGATQAMDSYFTAYRQ